MDEYYMVKEDSPITQVERDYLYRMLVDASDQQSKLLFLYLSYLEELALNQD